MPRVNDRSNNAGNHDQHTATKEDCTGREVRWKKRPGEQCEENKYGGPREHRQPDPVLTGLIWDTPSMGMLGADRHDYAKRFRRCCRCAARYRYEVSKRTQKCVE